MEVSGGPDALVPRGSTRGPNPRRNRRGWAFWCVLLLPLLAVTLPGRTAFSGDSELAKFLMKGARADLDKKQYEDAAKKLEKARAEDPSLSEAAYWQGVAFEGLKDAKRAVASYRAFIEEYEPKRAATKSTPDEDAAYPKAQARLTVLDASASEYRKIQDAYVAQLLAFAEENFVRDPAITTRSLRMILEIRPTMERARDLLQKLGGAEAAAVEAATDPLGVKEWTDLLKADLWESNSILVIEGAAGKIDLPHGAFSLLQKDPPTDRFAYDAEFRFTGIYKNTATFGLVFAFADREFVMGVFAPERVDIATQRLSDGQSQHLAGVFLKPRIQVDEWHRGTIVVDGRKIELLLDGKEVVEWTVPPEKKLLGGVGVFLQHGKVELRKMRFGARSGP